MYSPVQAMDAGSFFINQLKAKQMEANREYQPISVLLKKLGYKDPCPEAGKWNKKAQKERAAAIAKLNLKQYQVGTAKDYENDGYIKVPVYEFKGVKYSRA